MSLSLTAEQKSIIEIFSSKNQYIIPPYQRQYSWHVDQCMELLEDLKLAYHTNKDEGYFLGNIVIAKSRDEKNKLEVIDGQQRLITLTLLMKVLLSFDKDNSDLKKSIWIIDTRDTEKVQQQRLITQVFEERDALYLKDALSIDLGEYPCEGLNKKENNFKKNICFFYNELKEFNQINGIENFSDFVTQDVYLLPIQSEDDNKERAREKALKIFETINDRGLNLSDSDIFKAKLYSLAQNELKQDDFISEWTGLYEESEAVGYSIDEIFKIYTHIIRGEAGIKSAETGLREFFTQKEYSPFKTMSYREILEDLSKIISSIQFYQDVTRNPDKEGYGELSKWFQVIHQYTNQYPLTALLVYIFKRGTENTDKLISFSKNLIRYAYFKGSTTTVKFYIYEIIIKVMHKEKFQYRLTEVSEESFSYLGRLKHGYALLAFYLQENQAAIYPYYFDKVINKRDLNQLDNTWAHKEFSDYVDTLGNLLVIDFPKKNTSFENRVSSYEFSSLKYLNKIFSTSDYWTYSKYLTREKKIKKVLTRFFQDEN